MAQTVAPEDLLDIQQVAEFVGVTRQTVSCYLSRGKERFPEPIMRASNRPVWTRQQIEQWLATRPGSGIPAGPARRALKDAVASGLIVKFALRAHGRATIYLADSRKLYTTGVENTLDVLDALTKEER